MTQQRTRSQISRPSVTYCRNYCKDCFCEIPVTEYQMTSSGERMDTSKAYRRLQEQHRVRCDECAQEYTKLEMQRVHDLGLFDGNGQVVLSVLRELQQGRELVVHG